MAAVNPFYDLGSSVRQRGTGRMLTRNSAVVRLLLALAATGVNSALSLSHVLAPATRCETPPCNCAGHSCCSNAAGGCCDADGVTPCGGNSCTDRLCAARSCETCQAAAPVPPPPIPPPPPVPPPPPTVNCASTTCCSNDDGGLCAADGVSACTECGGESCTPGYCGRGCDDTCQAAAPPPPCTGESAWLHREDCVAWVDFFDATAGSSWLACSEARTDPCSCSGASMVLPPHAAANVTCNSSETHTIGAVSLHGLGLNGDIGAAIAALSKLDGLRKLDLGDNQLTGVLPARILNTDVNYLDLGANPGLLGSIPDRLGSLTDLKYLNLSRCGLSGEIPEQMYDVSDIVTLDLSRNSLTGPIPSGKRE
jgi:hypothetical protein